jgi:hypothetical protein
MPVPASASTRCGRPAMSRGSKARAAGGIARCPSRGSAPSPTRSRQPSLRLGLVQPDRHGIGAGALSSHCGQAREEPALACSGFAICGATSPRPRPAQPGERLRRRPRAFALRPGGSPSVAEQAPAARCRKRPRRRRRSAVPDRARARGPAASAPRSAPDGRRHTAPADRARIIRQSEPRRHQRRVEHDRRRDRLARDAHVASGVARPMQRRKIGATSHD